MSYRTTRAGDYGLPTLLQEISDMQTHWDRFFGAQKESHYPGVNVYANDDQIVVTSEIPGVSGDDLSLSVADDVLTISFSRPKETGEEGMRVLRRERPSGKFTRNVYLPYRVDNDKIGASLNNGMLTVRLPRAEADKPRKIRVS